MIQVKEVKTKREQRAFLNFPLKLYEGNPYFVPPLYIDEKKIFRKDYVYYDQSEAVYYLAYREGKIVGRISAILQRVSNEKWGQKRVRFTRFDCIDDQEVASALFAAAENWAKERGMEEVVGPLGFSDLEREGLLIEGFDELSTFEEQYNFPYYQKLIENCGYEKDVDWVESQLRAPKEIDPRYEKLSQFLLKKHGLRFSDAKNTREFIRRYADPLFDLLDLTYADIYGSVPMTSGMKRMMIDNFKLIVDIKYVTVILNEKDEVVCFGICFPSIAKALQKSKGHLTPAALVRVLRAIKHPKVLDLALIGVRPEYRMKGVSTAILSGLMNYLRTDIEYAETNLNLEHNDAIRNQWKAFDARQHKRRRCFVKRIAGEGATDKN